MQTAEPATRTTPENPQPPFPATIPRAFENTRRNGSEKKEKGFRHRFDPQPRISPCCPRRDDSKYSTQKPAPRKIGRPPPPAGLSAAPFRGFGPLCRSRRGPAENAYCVTSLPSPPALPAQSGNVYRTPSVSGMLSMSRTEPTRAATRARAVPVKGVSWQLKASTWSVSGSTISK